METSQLCDFGESHNELALGMLVWTRVAQDRSNDTQILPEPLGKWTEGVFLSQRTGSPAIEFGILLAVDDI